MTDPVSKDTPENESNSSSDSRPENGQECKCSKCGYPMQKYVKGIGTECRCLNCGFKDSCCD